MLTQIPIVIVIFFCHYGATIELETVAQKPININEDLKPLYFGNESDYFVSTYATDAHSAQMVCESLTSITGKRFHLLKLESKEEQDELVPLLKKLDLQGVWTAGQKTFDDEGNISLMWVTQDVQNTIEFRNFRSGISVRRRRDLLGIPRGYEFEPFDDNSVETTNSRAGYYRMDSNYSTLLEPWLNMHMPDGGSGRCRKGKFVPECKPIECSVSLPDCTVKTNPCKVVNETACEAFQPPCSAKCENCTVINPICIAIPQPCQVTTPRECQVIRPPCEVITPECTVTRPPCKVYQPPCNITEPPPCTTKRPNCIPSFRKNCTSVGNETVCTEAYDACEQVCQSPAILCPSPITYCPPEEIHCPDAILKCAEPQIYCIPPTTVCPPPKVECTFEKVECESPVVNCPGKFVNCDAPDIVCPPPDVTCPPVNVTCSEPEPCSPPPPLCPWPEPTTEEPTTPSSTPKPCVGCGCIYMNTLHNLKWDIAKCEAQSLHFVCEG